MDEVTRFVGETAAASEPLEKRYRLAEWESAVGATPEALAHEQRTQEAFVSFWADPERCRRARQLMEDLGGPSPIPAGGGAPAEDRGTLHRQLELVVLEAARHQQDPQTLKRVVAVEREVRDHYYNVRGVVGGRRLDDNELERLLALSTDAEEVRQAWEASKQVGREVAPSVRELARLRNRAARELGYRDHFQRALAQDEIAEEELLPLLERLAQASRPLYQALKERVDRLRAQRFGIRVDELRPWHYGDRFFQRAPRLEEADLDGLFAERDLADVAAATYDGLGLEVRDILAASDLYPREGKNQHAFCTHIDRRGDIRTLNNLAPTWQWNGTLHHELGHAVYEKHLDPALPWLLRTPAHSLSTEAVALLLESLPADPQWLEGVLGLEARRAEKLAAAASRQERAGRLIFSRWCLVVVHFERQLYADPEQDLDGLWWQLVEKYQLLRRPEGRQAPDWAAKIHIALVPVYYQNYQLGHLVAAQLRHHLEAAAGGLVGRREAGEWLIRQVFRPGARLSWQEHVRQATGEPLDPRYFVASLAGE